MFIFCNSRTSCHFSVIVLEHKPGLVTGLPKPFSVTPKPEDWVQTLQSAPTSLGLSAALSATPHLLIPLTPSAIGPLAFPQIAILSLCLQFIVLSNIFAWGSSPSHPTPYPVHLLFSLYILDLVSRSQTLVLTPLL